MGVIAYWIRAAVLRLLLALVFGWYKLREPRQRRETERRRRQAEQEAIDELARNRRYDA